MTNKKREDLRVVRTRRWLQRALRDLMQEKAFEKIKVSEIVKRAEVSRPTFYLHFESKDHLLLSLFDEIFDELFKDLKKIYLDENYKPGQSAAYTINFLADQHEQFQTLLNTGVGNLVMERLIQMFIDVGKQWRLPISVEEAAIRPYAIDFFSGGIYLVIKRWLDDGMQTPIEPIANMVADVEIALIEFGARADQVFSAKNKETA